MTAEEKNDTIAELCGYVNQGKAKSMPALALRWFKDGKLVQRPSYTSDLNAMHEAEKTLTEHEIWHMTALLAEIVPERTPIAHATALQRCTAFLSVKGRVSE